MGVGLEFPFVTAVAFGVVLANLVDMVRGHRFDQARWFLCGLVAVGGAGFLLGVPSIGQNLDRVVGVPNVSVLLSYAGFLGCAVLVHLWISTWPGTALVSTPGRVRGRLLAVITAGDLIALTWLFVRGRHPVERTSGFAAAYVHDPHTTLMIFTHFAVYAGLFFWASIRIRRARRASAVYAVRWLGSGLVFLEVGIFMPVIYSATMMAGTASLLFGVSDAVWLSVSGALETISAIASCTAVTCWSWGPLVERHLGGNFDEHLARTYYRRLEPLSSLLVGVDDGMFRTRRGLGLLRHNPVAALAHEVCTIAEARERLTGYRSEAVSAEAVAWGRALADAIRITAAVQARRAGRSKLLCPATDSAADPGVVPESELRFADALTMLQSLHNSGEFARFVSTADGKDAPSVLLAPVVSGVAADL